MLDATTIATCADARELVRTLYGARTLHKKATVIGSAENVGPSDQWLFPAERWAGLEAKAKERLKQFMPQTSNALLPVPTALVLNRVFGLGRHARQAERQFSFPYGKATVTYTGPELRQFDARVLFALYEMSKRVPFGMPVAFRPSEVLRIMNTQPTGYYYDELEAAIRRLQVSLICIKFSVHSERSSFEVQLLGKREWKAGDPRGQAWIHIDREVRQLFGAGYTTIPLALRMSLPDGLVSWLATMLFAIRNKSADLKFPVSWLQESCGSKAGIRDFRKNLHRAFKHLLQNGVISQYTVRRDCNSIEVVSVAMA